MEENLKLMLGDNIESLKKLKDNSIDSVVTDPPYGLSFMGKKWDYDVPSTEFWKEIYRVLKPGGHVVSFGGTRTYHRMVVNMEDAGFEIRDQIMWIYGSGFPKSHNIGKAVDKLQDENEWEGWGTALKPANEPICLARKPLDKKSIVENVLEWGTGGINIDDSRVSHNEPIKILKKQEGGNKVYSQSGRYEDTTELKEEGRFPANIILECCCDEVIKSDIHTNPECPCYIIDQQNKQSSRFFYQAKVSKAERNMGLDDFENKIIEGRDKGQDDRSVAFKIRNTERKNTHPTVKPINLMYYLCKLITPPEGTILDPYMGSGSTGISALLSGFKFIGMEMGEEYYEIASSRINNYEEYRQFLKK